MNSQTGVEIDSVFVTSGLFFVSIELRTEKSGYRTVFPFVKNNEKNLSWLSGRHTLVFVVGAN